MICATLDGIHAINNAKTKTTKNDKAQSSGKGIEIIQNKTKSKKTVAKIKHNGINKVPKKLRRVTWGLLITFIIYYKIEKVNMWLTLSEHYVFRTK